MPKLFDRVKVNIATTGTGDITFGVASSNAFLTPTEAGCADTDTVRYILVDGTDFEEGIGTIASGVATMERTTVTKSKIGGTAGTSKINLSGTAVLALTASAADILNAANNLSDLASAPTALTNLGGTTVGKDLFTAADAAEARGTLEISDTLPTTQVFTIGSGTYTTPAGCLWIEVEMIGGGGGGAGSATSPGNGGAGGNTTFGSLTANGGGGTSSGAGGGAGGAASGGYFNKSGSGGGQGSGLANQWGGRGAASPFGDGGYEGQPNQAVGGAATANSGAGGGGAGCGATPNSGGGGGSGGYLRAIINTPSATYSYAVGAGGTAGTAGSGGVAGGAGGSGVIIVTEHYGS